jgi:hypothetical protein
MRLSLADVSLAAALGKEEEVSEAAAHLERSGRRVANALTGDTKMTIIVT